MASDFGKRAQCGDVVDDAVGEAGRCLCVSGRSDIGMELIEFVTRLARDNDAIGRGHSRSASGFVYLACVIDIFARRIVGWKVSTAPTASFVLDALEQAIHARPVPRLG